MRYFGRWFFLVVLFLFPLAVFSRSSNVYPPKNLYKYLLAEAGDQGHTGMYAVACVVRNRLRKGMWHGLVACRRRDLSGFVAKHTNEEVGVAIGVVKEVFFQNGKDVTYGADHYESSKYKRPRWSYNMTVTCRIGEHIFYRSRRR